MQSKERFTILGLVIRDKRLRKTKTCIVSPLVYGKLSSRFADNFLEERRKHDMRGHQIITIFLIAALLLAGCGKGNNQGSTLMEADPVQTGGKTKLVVATISSNLNLLGLDNVLSKTVSRFNQENPDYYVEILDYSQNGTISQEDALTKLNTEIISGKFPADMLCFSNISPYPYITRSLMLELQEKISQDPSFSLDDIAALKAFFVQDGLYFLGSSFIFTTAVGDSSNFGDRYGWTLQEYLDFEASNPEGWIIYNITQDYFFRCVASRYMRTAIDWQAGTCDFDNTNFIGILEASKRIMDKPESDDHILYASGGDSITSGELIVDFVYVTNFYDLARAQRNSSCKLSYVGWPTVDGRCGTDINVTCPVGILAQSNNTAGCWEFLKYMVMSGGDDYSFTTYMPKLKATYDAAMKDEEAPFQLTEEDREVFFNLLSVIENLSIYDTPAQNIILNESTDFFNGRKTAAETAKIVQSKISLYMAEQK